MKAEEFRIGNLIQKSLKSGKGRKIIEKIGYTDLGRIYYENDFFDYQPISLTEEWLVKCGFETDGVTFWKNGINIGNYKDGFFYLPNGLTGNKGIKIQYVHQLQNLYSALTGEELTLTK